MRSEQTSGASHEKIVMAPSDTETEPSEAPFGMKQGRAGRIALPVRCAGSTSWQRFYCTALVGKRLRKRLDKLSGLKALYLYILWKSSIYCGRVPPRCIYAFQPRYALTLGEREREADEETDELLFALGCSVHREGLSLHHLWNDALKLSPFRLPIFLAECRAIFCRLDDIFRADLVFNQRTGFSRSDVPRQGKASTKVKLEPHTLSHPAGSVSFASASCCRAR